jgi:hypothetical protein
MHHRIRISCFAFLAFPIAGCGEMPAPVALTPSPPLERMTFTLRDSTFEIQLPERPWLPEGSKMVALRDHVIFHASPRAMRFIKIANVKQKTPTVVGRTQTLSNGSTLVFRVNYNVGGGSGGTEGTLVGRVEINGQRLSVTCGDQIEGSRPDPEWCIPYLGTLAIVPASR